MILQGLVLNRQLFLNGHGTIERVQGTGKLSQKVVSRRIDNSPVVIFDKLADEHAETRDGLDCGHLIVTHEPAVIFHIRAQNGSQFSDDLIRVLHHIAKPSILVSSDRICISSFCPEKIGHLPFAVSPAL